MTRKFTYSRKDKSRPRNNEDTTPDDEDSSRKRRKTDSPSETSSFVSVPTISSTASSIRAKSSAIFKKTSQLFGGPVSIPQDDADVEVTPKSRKSLSAQQQLPSNTALRGAKTSQQRAYTAKTTPHSGRDLFGDRLPQKSTELQLWRVNQSKSLFLRLPEKVRAQIYRYALGGKTITIGYETYRTVESVSGTDRVVPVFRYCCAVYSQRDVNPFKKQLPYINVSYGFTLLNNICRQLYNETATLPYTLNTLAFSTHNTMLNFLFLEQRLSREQRDAITSVTLQDALPMANLLTFMRNLQKVVLTDDMPGNLKGTYKVTRVKGKAPKLLNTKHVWGG
ncbi:hypothetical protein N0V95_000753 [Ascochyta clinopodiicola]|nr:hypothetical protein N0V95_000753 [Ascochyta clinopodiicola]